MKVAILGNGFVGNATRYYLEKYCPNVKEIVIEDPGQGLHIDDWNDAPIWTKNKIHIATKSWFKYLK